jgi:hypothetical protein
MSSVYFIGNASLQAQIVTGTVTAVAIGGTLTATINGKQVTYTCVSGDTTSTAAAAWATLLRASLNPEFQEENWTAAANVLTVSGTPGLPFAGITGGLVMTAGGGSAVTQATTQANKSPSDVGDPNNWLRNGVPALPQNGDDVVLQECSVPMTVNCDALSTIRPLTITRWQSHTGQIGLPFTNPAGYQEYRATYLQFGGTNGGQINVLLGVGAGSGPSLERWQINNTGQVTNVVIQNAQNVELIPNGNTNTLDIHNATVSVAMNPGESSIISSGINLDSGGTLNIGANVTLTGSAIVVNNGTLNLFANTAPATLTITSGTLVVGSSGISYPSIVASGSNISWPSNSPITNLTLRAGSTLDLSHDHEWHRGGRYVPNH